MVMCIMLSIWQILVRHYFIVRSLDSVFYHHYVHIHILSHSMCTLYKHLIGIEHF